MQLLSVNFAGGSGRLFFEYVRIRDYLRRQADEENYSFYWVFENTANMENRTKDSISK